jgi:hypothetical protein
MPQVDAYSKEILAGNTDKRVVVVNELVDNPSLFFPVGVIVYDRSTKALYEVGISDYVALPSLAYQYETVADLPDSAEDGAFAFVRDTGSIYSFDTDTWVEFVSSSTTGIPVSQKGAAGGVAALNGSSDVIEIPATLPAVNSVAALGAVSAGRYNVINITDGGRAGQFVWQAGDQSANVTADPGQGIWVAPSAAPTGVSGAWRRQGSGNVFNVRHFGAIGDGNVANANADTQGIQAAINAAGTGYGGTVYMPAGTYRINATLTLDTAGTGDNAERISIVGDGIRRTQLFFSPADGTDFLSGSLAGVVRRVYLADFSVRATGGSGQGHCINIERLDRGWAYERLEIRGFVGAGKACIYLDQCLGGSIRDVVLGTFDGVDNEISNGIILVGDSDINALTNIAISSFQEYGILATNKPGIGPGGVARAPSGLTITNPFIVNSVNTFSNPVGIRLEGAPSGGGRHVLINPWLEGVKGVGASGIGIQITDDGSSSYCNIVSIIGGEFEKNDWDITVTKGRRVLIESPRPTAGITVSADSAQCTIIAPRVGSLVPIDILNNTTGLVRAGENAITLISDASITFDPDTYGSTVIYADSLTANRTITLPTGNTIIRGDKLRVTRTGMGAFSLDIGGLQTLPASTAGFVDVAYDGTAWRLVGYGLF